MRPGCTITTDQEVTDPVICPLPVAVPIPAFKSLSFEDAIRLFKPWGFQVEPGPRPEEVTLIVEGPDYRTVSVYDAGMLPEIAAAALRVRWQNGTLCRQEHGRDGNRCEARLL